MLVEFPSVVEAVKCAVEVQRGMAARNAAIASDRRVEFRMGINIGDLIEDAGDVFGDGVNVAARLEGIAPRGGICVSRQVLDLVEGKIDLDCRELGRQNLKNIARPVEVFSIDVHGKGSLADRVLANPISGRRCSIVLLLMAFGSPMPKSVQGRCWCARLIGWVI